MTTTNTALAGLFEALAGKLSPAGPYSVEAFNEVLDGYDAMQAMILAGDGESIFAQCMKDDAAFALAELLNNLQASIAALRATDQQALAERDAEIARLKALKAPSPQWFYLAGDMSSDKCRFGVHEVIDEDWLWDNRAEGSAVVQIEVTAPLPDIWCAVRFFTNEEKDQRQSDDDYELTEHPTEEAARAALGDTYGTE